MMSSIERETTREETLKMWMALNNSITQELLDLRLRVQNLEDKLGIKQKVRVSKG